MGSRLHGKNILLVGAAGKLGPAWAEGVLEEGATLFALGPDLGGSRELAGLAARFPGNVFMGHGDVTVPLLSDQLGRAFSGVDGQLKFHGVVYNAGVDSLPGAASREVMNFDSASWDRIFRVNVFGFANIVTAVTPLLADSSSIVAVGSMYGIVSPRIDLYSHYFDGEGSLKHPAYGASKAALLATVRQLGTHMAQQGTRVNALTLGGVAGNQDAEFVAKFSAQNPQQRMVPVSEAIGAMTYLLCDDSLSMTAQNLVLDGGYTAW